MDLSAHPAHVRWSAADPDKDSGRRGHATASSAGEEEVQEGTTARKQGQEAAMEQGEASCSSCSRDQAFLFVILVNYVIILILNVSALFFVIIFVIILVHSCICFIIFKLFVVFDRDLSCGDQADFCRLIRFVATKRILLSGDR